MSCKPSTFKKSASIKLTPSPPHPPHPPPQLEFPTSPQLIMGEEIVHFGHPQHPLSHIDLPDLFSCSGCKEYGSGKRFTCQQCYFQLHEFCTLAPPTLKAHPFHLQHQLLFFSKPGRILQSKCDVCGKPIKGYTFRCNACSYQMHPCCAMLSNEINISVHPHLLKILPATNNSSNAEAASSSSSSGCAECNRKRSGRMYSCTVCEYHLHAVCAKNMVNGLPANGIKGSEKSSKLGRVVELVSIMVVEFIGSLVQGLGEGIGQAVIQSITKGRRRLPANNNNN